MSRVRLTPAIAALLSCVSLSAGASADTLPPLTPEQAASLQRAIRLWDPISMGMAKDGLATVTPADGYYGVVFPTANWLASHGDSGPGSISARATAGPDGRWHLDNITFPSPIVTDNLAKPGDSPVRMTQEFTAQTGGAVIDPTLATPSSGDWRCGYTLRLDGHFPAFSATAKQLREQRDISPASPGRADFASLISVDELATRLPGPVDAAANVTTVSVHQIVVATQAGNLDLDRLTTVLPQAVAFATELSQAAKPVQLSAAQRAQAHELLSEARHLADGAKETLTFDGIAVTDRGRSGGLDRLVYAQSFAAPDGKGEMRLRLELAGLSLPFLPPGMVGDFMPHRLVVAPSFTGLSMDDVFQVLDRLIDTDAPKPDMIAAHVEATGLDALLKQASSNPLLQQVAPVLIFLKGIGDTQGAQTVWEIAYHDHKLTVNGTDLSSLMPGGK